eukprot:GAHX01001312.1.p2 GENE.GAHX01001312.1~~GAHX01001312.1.p2  ORF type:complete len:91 (-),score=24.73 GAHX01001312.1:101-373(-)
MKILTRNDLSKNKIKALNLDSFIKTEKELFKLFLQKKGIEMNNNSEITRTYIPKPKSTKKLKETKKKTQPIIKKKTKKDNNEIMRCLNLI